MTEQDETRWQRLVVLGRLIACYDMPDHVFLDTAIATAVAMWLLDMDCYATQQ